MNADSFLTRVEAGSSWTDDGQILFFALKSVIESVFHSKSQRKVLITHLNIGYDQFVEAKAAKEAQEH